MKYRNINLLSFYNPLKTPKKSGAYAPKYASINYKKIYTIYFLKEWMVFVDGK
jgi:hypothetical protein